MVVLASTVMAQLEVSQGKVVQAGRMPSSLLKTVNEL